MGPPIGEEEGRYWKSDEMVVVSKKKWNLAKKTKRVFEFQRVRSKSLSAPPPGM